MRILLAGALGEVGRELGDALAARGHEVIAVSSRAPLASHPGVIGLESVGQLVGDGAIDLVVNAAGPGDHRPGRGEAMEWSSRLLNLVADVPSVLISSTRVLEGCTGLVAETVAACPTSDYARANAANESAWLQSPRGSVLRLVNFFGRPASPDAPQTRLLPWSLLIEGWERGQIAVRAEEQTSKEFVDARDVAAALEVIAFSPPVDKLAVAGPGLPLSLGQLAEASRLAIEAVNGGHVAVTFGGEQSHGGVRVEANWLTDHGWTSALSIERVTEQMVAWLVQWGSSIPRVGPEEGR